VTRPPGVVRKVGAKNVCAQARALRAVFFLSTMVATSACTAQVAEPARDRFADPAQQVRMPFEWADSMIFVPLRVAGSEPLRFILDTGSTRMLIDRQVARRLGIVTTTSGSLQGAGAGRVPIETAENVDIALPGLESAGYALSTIDLKPTSTSENGGIDGIIGYEFFSRFVITVDYARKTLTIAAPGVARPGAGVEVIPLEIRDKWAYVKGALAIAGPVTIQDTFLLDSGSGDAVDHPVVKSVPDRIVSKSGVGLGTPIEGAVGHAVSFRLASYVMLTPVVSCCGATEATSRLIGNEVLRRFTVTFDYPSSRLWLVPNATLNDSFPPIQPQGKSE
jgi:hypothetical protein